MTSVLPQYVDQDEMSMRDDMVLFVHRSLVLTFLVDPWRLLLLLFVELVIVFLHVVVVVAVGDGGGGFGTL